MKYISFLILFCLLALPVLSQERITTEEEARSIFEQVEERRNSVESEKATMEMTIADSRGRTRNRTMQMWSKTEGDDTKSLIVFSSPGNVSGTAFLTVNEDGSRTQRLYLPSVGRVQIITSSERGDRFMGSDFTYEDLGDQNSEDYNFEWLEEGSTEYTVRAAKPDSDQYTHVEFIIDKEKFTINKIHYYNSSNEEIKRLEAEDFEQLSDELWSPSIMTMFDLRENRKTELRWSNREVNVQVEDWRFTERGLRRGV